MLRNCADQNAIRSMLPTIVSGVISWLEKQAAEDPAFRFELRRLLSIVGDMNSDCSEEAETICSEPDVEAVKVAKFLEGRSAVLIGGTCRPQAKLGLEQALGLKELDWIEVSGVGRAFEVFESHVSRPDVAVVLLAIRWSKHSFGAVMELCKKHGKFFVRIPAGYNPNQIAHQILQQCGDRLAGTFMPRL